jgi:membrane protease YdiL (CAAX protease family)
MTDRRRALVALMLLAPVPSLGVVAAMVVAPGPVGHGIFLAAKVWLLVFPAAWHLLVDHGQASWSPPRRGGLLVGALSGVAMAMVITAVARVAVARGFDPTALHATVGEIGLATPAAFAAGAAAWTLGNSLIEEYVYRWFVFSQSDRLFGGTAAICLSAAIFTAHHVIAVSRYLDPGLAILASAGVFAGGVVWAWLYRRYRSVWPGWLSHVVADAAVFGVGWWLLFG